MKIGICSQCSIEKELMKNRRMCKDCRRINDKLYRTDNKEHIKKIMKIYNSKNKKRLSDRNRQYNLDNKEHRKEWRKLYREKNKVEIDRKSRLWRENNPELKKAYDKRHWAENKIILRAKAKERSETIKGRIFEWRGGARQRGIKWDLSVEQLHSMPLICHYTGISLTLKRGYINTVSLDRIDSDNGYTLDNIVFCCSAINLMKLDHSIDQFVSLCKMVNDKFQNSSKPETLNIYRDETISALHQD